MQTVECKEISMEVEELEEESSETMIEDYKYYRRKLYNHMRYVEKSIEEKNNHSGEENLKECFMYFEKTKKASHFYKSSKEASYDLWKILKLESEVKSHTSSRWSFEEMMNSVQLDQEHKNDILLFELQQQLTQLEAWSKNPRRIISIFDAMSPSKTKHILHIELFGRDLLPDLPASSPQPLVLSEIVGSLGVARAVATPTVKAGPILQLVLDTPWALAPREQEEALAAVLTVSSSQATLLPLSRRTIQRYVELVMGDTSASWNYVDLVLHLGDRLLASATWDGDMMEANEKIAGGLSLLACAFHQKKMLCHLAESLIYILLKQRKFQEIDQYLCTLKFPFRDSVEVRKLLIMRYFMEGEHSKVAEHLSRLLEADFGDDAGKVTVEEILSWLTDLLPALLESEEENVSNTATLVSYLAERQFLHDWNCLKFSLKIAVEHSMSAILVKLYSNMHLISWADSLDDGCEVSRLLWNYGLLCDCMLAKHVSIFLAGFFLAPLDPEVKASTYLASVSAGFEVIHQVNDVDLKQCILRNIFKILETCRSSCFCRRSITLFTLKLSIVSDGQYDCDPQQVLAQLSKDHIGLLTVSTLCLSSNNERISSYAIDALMDAVNLDTEEDNKQVLVVASLEVMTEATATVRVLRVFEVVKSVRWTNQELALAAMKLSWNNWAKACGATRKQTVCQPWSRIFIFLHNVLSDYSDHIIGDNNRPTIALLQRVNRLVKTIENSS